MVDGSMLFTDYGWQETKVGRIFQAEQSVDNKGHKWDMGMSHYTARRGHYSGFTADFEQALPPHAYQKIFVADWAAWIGQWIAQQYRGAVQIIDFFHVFEKLAPLAPKGDVKWLARQKEFLLKDGVDTVIAEVIKLRPMLRCFMNR
jgi:hypothetical protein